MAVILNGKTQTIMMKKSINIGEGHIMSKYIKADYEATIPQDMLYAPDGNPNMLRDYFRQRGGRR